MLQMLLTTEWAPKKNLVTALLILLLCVACARTPCGIYSAETSHKDVVYSRKPLEQTSACVLQLLNEHEISIAGFPARLVPIAKNEDSVGFLMKVLYGTVYVVKVHVWQTSGSTIESFYPQQPLTLDKIIVLDKEIKKCAK